MGRNLMNAAKGDHPQVSFFLAGCQIGGHCEVILSDFQKKKKKATLVPSRGGEDWGG